MIKIFIFFPSQNMPEIDWINDYSTTNDNKRIQTNSTRLLTQSLPNFGSSVIEKRNQKQIFTKTKYIMNALRNHVQLIGRLGANIDVKKLDSGKAVGKVSLATNEVYKNQKGERVEETTWHNLVVWGKNAEILEKYTEKGAEIGVSGKISNRSYVDKEGIKKYITEIVVNEVLLLGDRREKVGNEAEADLPF